MKRRVAWSLALGLVVVGTASIDRARGGSRAQAVAAYARLPLSFEPNHGQTDPRVRFLGRGIGHTVFLTQQELVVATADNVLRMRFVAANPQARVAGLEPLPGKANYFIGRDPARWHANVPLYGQVRYHDLYSGIDLTVSGDHRHLDFAFVVSAGADPSHIVLAWQGADARALGSPVLYQELGGGRREIAGRYVPRDAHQVGFAVANYDTGRPLVIGGRVPLSNTPPR